eukprot:14856906-Heterocapsa_arctica.AAC.1
MKWASACCRRAVAPQQEAEAANNSLQQEDGQGKMPCAACADSTWKLCGDCADLRAAREEQAMDQAEKEHLAQTLDQSEQEQTERAVD